MIERTDLKGVDYTLHIRDATSQGGTLTIDVSENRLNKFAECTILLAHRTLSVDDVARLILQDGEPVPVDPALVERIGNLVKDVHVDLSAPLSKDE